MKPFLNSLCFLLMLLLPLSAEAHSYKKGDIQIGHIWMRATPMGATTAAIYMPLSNAGQETDRLLGGSSPVAAKIEIHESLVVDGVMRMRKLDALALEPRKPVSLKPRGLHLMVFGLKERLKEGEKIPLTLQFEKAGTVDVEVDVEAVGKTAIEHKGKNHE
ncbi:MAG: copper chaperone PCu(A)C [Alphaproteobacteria bacterium]